MGNKDLDKDIEALVEKYYQCKTGEFIPGETYIPATTKSVDGRELTSLLHSAMDFERTITEGETTRLFEQALAKFLGTKYSIFCNSGSSANLLAFMALTSPKLGNRAIKPGDEVITCAVGFPTTVAPIIQAGCIPVYVDVNLSSYNTTPFMIEDAITDKTKAIFLAHTLGNPFDVEAIHEIAEQNNLWLIEDCCDALGGKFAEKNVGTWGDVSTTSFFPAHQITTGEGGMVFTDSPMLNQIIRSLRDWGRECFCLPGKDNTCGNRFGFKNKGELPDCFDHKYIYSHVGYNLKSTDLQASIGIEQLKKLPEFILARRNNWKTLHDSFISLGLNKYFILPEYHQKANPSWFGFALTIKDDRIKRMDLVGFLEERKIGTRNLFAGNIIKQPGFLGIGRIADSVSSSLPKADIVMNKVFWIGCHPSITKEMLDYMVEAFVDFTENL